jgi:glycosyltransferase involved in cell wall biosynthesis
VSRRVPRAGGGGVAIDAAASLRPSPRASVAIAVAGADRAAVARSVASALAQSETSLEVLLLAREEPPRDLVAGDPRARWEPLGGAAATLGGALHAALCAARAPYVCVLQAGQTLARDAIERHLAAIEAYPPPAATIARVAGSAADERNGSGLSGERSGEPPTRGGALRDALRGAPPPLGASLLRRDLALAAGGFDATFTARAADDFWLRFLPRFAVRGVDGVLLGVPPRAEPADAEVAAAEGGRALVRAFARFAVDEILAATSDGVWLDPARARLDLARALLSSGVAEAGPLAHELIDDALRRGAELPDEPAFAGLEDLLPELTRREIPAAARLGGRELSLGALDAPAASATAGFPARLVVAVRSADLPRRGVAALVEQAGALRVHGVDVVVLGAATDRADVLDERAAAGARVEVLGDERSPEEIAALLVRSEVGALVAPRESALARVARGAGVVVLDPEAIDAGFGRAPGAADAGGIARALRTQVLAAARAEARARSDGAEAAARALAGARAASDALRLVADGIMQGDSVTGRVAAHAGWSDAQRQELATIAREAESLVALAPVLRLRAQRILDKLRLGHRLGAGVRALRARFAGGASRVKSLDASLLERFLAAATGAGGWLWVVYATDPYSETRGQRSTWLARELARRGHHVVYLYWRWRMSDDILASGDPRVLSVPIDQLPAIQRRLLRFGDGAVRKVFLAEFPDVALFERLTLFAAHGFVTVYDCIDDWAEFARVGQAYWYDEAVERHLARNADVVVATHPRLAEELARVAGRIVPLVPNGVDLDSLQASERPRSVATTVIGYFGHLTPSWFDWDLVREAAARHPDWRFEIVGYGQGEDLVVPANVVLPGMVPHERLAAQTASWTVAVIPFREGRLTQAVDPVKLYEYLALGLPVVAVGMPHLRDVPGVVVCGRDDFDAAVVRAIETPLDRARVAAFVDASRWSRRVDALLEHVAAADPAANAVKALAG